MKAIHWVRARQEERELTYWLSFTAYEHRDRSFANRIYLLYLIVFLSIWVFVMLTFFAGGGAVLLSTINPANPGQAAVFLEVLLLGVWCGYRFWQALRRSPIVFSEQDEMLLCRTPVNRRHVVIRWLLMPWLKSAIPFWLAAVGLGFSVAETTFTGVLNAGYLPQYAVYGLRAWLIIAPVHFALFSFQWSVGIIRMRINAKKQWLFWLAIPLVVALFALLFCYAFDPAFLSLPFWNHLAEAMLAPLQAGFSGGSLAVSWIACCLFSVAAVGILYLLAGSLNLTRAARETHDVETLVNAQRYGFSGYSVNMKTRQRLGVMRKPTRMPAVSGAGSLIWKDILQFQRSFQLSSVFIWVQIFVLMLGLSFLSQPGSYAMLIAVWVILTGQVSAARFRSDLACYVLTRQLPISRRRFVLFEPALACLLAILISLTGLTAGSVIFNTPLTPIAALVPGIIVSTASLAIFDVIRQSRDHLLLNGSIPNISAGGVLLGVIAAGIPILVQFLLPGPAGLLLSVLVSLGLAWLAFNLAVITFRILDIPRQG